MKSTFSGISLVAATLLLAVIVIAGVRERVVNIPNWFANPPASFDLIRKQAPAAQRFWIPLQILFFIALILAIASNWKYRPVRNLLIAGSVVYLLVVGLTAGYFLREVMYFSRLPADAPATPELLQRAKTWYQTTISRNILQGIALAFLVTAIHKRFK